MSMFVLDSNANDDALTKAESSGAFCKWQHIRRRPRTNPSQDEVQLTGSWPLRGRIVRFLLVCQLWFIKVFDGAEK